MLDFCQDGERVRLDIDLEFLQYILKERTYSYDLIQLNGATSNVLIAILYIFNAWKGPY